MNAWDQTFDEYKAARIADSGVSEEEYCEASSDEHLRREWLDALADPPRDYELDLRVYDTLPIGMQRRWLKFSFNLEKRLTDRAEAEMVQRSQLYAPAEQFLSQNVATLEAQKPNLNTYGHKRLERMRGLLVALQAPFATAAEKNDIVSKVKRFRGFV